jgi:hypothetical protein
MESDVVDRGASNEDGALFEVSIPNLGKVIWRLTRIIITVRMPLSEVSHSMLNLRVLGRL